MQTEETDSAVDLTGAVSTKFFMYPIDDAGVLGTVKINGVAGAIDDAAAGKLTYTWTGTDTDTAGKFIGYFIVYWGATSTNPQTFTGVEINIKNPVSRMT